MIKLFLAVYSITLTMACGTRISGKLVDATGHQLNISGATVNISDLSGQKNSRSLDVNTDGTFRSSSDIQPGEYYVEVLAPGYDINALRIRIQESKKIIFKMKRSDTARIKDFKLRSTDESANYSRASGNVTLRPPSI